MLVKKTRKQNYERKCWVINIYYSLTDMHCCRSSGSSAGSAWGSAVYLRQHAAIWTTYSSLVMGRLYFTHTCWLWYPLSLYSCLAVGVVLSPTEATYFIATRTSQSHMQYAETASLPMPNNLMYCPSVANLMHLKPSVIYNLMHVVIKYFT